MIVRGEIAQGAAAVQPPPAHAAFVAGCVTAEIAEVAAAPERNDALHPDSAQTLADEDAVDLGGAQQDSAHSGMRPDPRDRRLVRIAQAAMQPEASVRDPKSELPDPPLRAG